MIFSILIPSWNNLPYLKLCIESIRKNSKYAHQIIVHVNEGTDGTLDWVREQNIDYTYTESNAGVCMSVNLMRYKVTTDYILYLNDDMYVLPGWDEVMSAEVERIGHKMFYLSGTMIQATDALGLSIMAKYGTSPDDFEEDRLLKEYKSYAKQDSQGAMFPPSLCHRYLWDMVGGYSIEYTPGMYSDPDFMAKLWVAGVRYFKCLGDCRVYHFETKTTGRIQKNDGAFQFMLKWGFSASTFRKKFLHLGDVFSESKVKDIDMDNIKSDCRKYRLKSIFKLMKGFGVLTNKLFGNKVVK